MKMSRVAVATCDQFPELEDDDRLLAAALTARGCEPVAAVWDDAVVDWSSFDRVLIRSTWGYHEKPDAYRLWLEGFRARPGTLWNPPDVVADNVHKGYLLDLERAGIPIVPTELVRAGAAASLREIRARRGWSRVVVKPAVSAGAANTWNAEAGSRGGEAFEARFRDLVADRDMLVQPYLDEIHDEGEWSLVFIAGGFSHAIVKTPAEGDFRVQTEHGGTFRAGSPSAGLIDQAARVVKAIRRPWLFARVDGVVHDGRFLLLELEVNEPYLGFHLAPGSAVRLAEALVATLAG